VNHAVHLAKHSSCPSSAWLDAIAPRLFTGEPGIQYHFFNVGANKGFAIASMLQRFGLLQGNASTWHVALEGELRKTHPRLASGTPCKSAATCPKTCGVCGACREPPPQIMAPSAGSIKVHAFEMLHPNAQWLEIASRRFAPLNTVRVSHAVVSDHDGEACVPSGLAVGVEAAQAIVRPRASAEHKCRQRTWQRVPKIMLDTYMAHHGIERVQLLSVDAEGHDAMVLDGANASLARRAIDVLEFEYHHMGDWAQGRRSLRLKLAQLHAFGYACFWQAAPAVKRPAFDSPSGNSLFDSACELAPASGECWSNAFEIRKHSNLVCAHGSKHHGPQRLLWQVARRSGCLATWMMTDGLSS